MENSSTINASARATIAPNTTHQSIGKNGSFWLPPKSSGAEPPSSNSKTSSTPKQIREQQTKGRNHLLSTNNRATLKQEFKVELRSSDTTAKGSSNQSEKAPSKLRVAPQKTTFNQAKTQNLHPKLQNYSPAKNIAVSQIKVPKENNITKSDNIFGKVDPDAEKKNDQKKETRDGTRNATKVDKMPSNSTDAPFSDTLSKGEANNSLTDTQKLKSFIRQSILPRLSYVSTFEKKVLRFAIDLPNGIKLGVRIEKNLHKTSCDFICSDQDTTDILRSYSEDISGESQSLIIGVFESYHDMDRAKTLAA